MPPTKTPDVLPKAIADQIAAFCQDQAPTYEHLEKHIALLTTTLLCFTADTMSPDYLELAFSHAKSVLTKELDFPPELVDRCLEQLRHESQRLRRRSFMVASFGAL